MTEIHLSLPRYALESLFHDTAFHFTLINRAIRHPHSGLIMFGTTPLTSLFIVESYDYLSSHDARVGQVLGAEHIPTIRASRHRAKLFGCTTNVVNQVLSMLRAFAIAHKEYYNRDHVGLLAPLKRYIQPDLGLFSYDGHIFSTTHESAYNFGDHDGSGRPISMDELGTFAHEFGRVTGRYLAQLIEIFEIPISDEFLQRTVLQGEIVMKDVKSNALFSRGPIGTLGLDLAGAMVVLLAHLNYVIYVLRELAPAKSPTYFKIRFLAAYHATISLRVLQGIARRRNVLKQQVDRLLRGLISDRDSKWICQQLQLRNMLVHYAPKTLKFGGATSDMSFRDAVENLSRGRSYEDISALVDRFLAFTSRTLEEGFRWSRNSFWYGQVKDS